MDFRYAIIPFCLLLSYQLYAFEPSATITIDPDNKVHPGDIVSISWMVNYNEPIQVGLQPQLSNDGGKTWISSMLIMKKDGKGSNCNDGFDCSTAFVKDLTDTSFIVGFIWIIPDSITNIWDIQPHPVSSIGTWRLSLAIDYNHRFTSQDWILEISNPVNVKNSESTYRNNVPMLKLNKNIERAYNAKGQYLSPAIIKNYSRHMFPSLLILYRD